jgi:esterase/lipase superfamily enzyme
MEVKTVEKCILVLAADPRSTDRLELEREAATIWKELQEGEPGRDYEVRIEQGTKIEDVARYLVEYQPTIVHIVGHGSATGEIFLKNALNQTQPVAPSAFAKLFATVERKVDCVVLNSCFSLAMADELVAHVRCTIGIDEEIDDRSATFIGEFYRELGTGKPYYQAFDLGRTHIESDFDEPNFISRDRTIFDLPTNAREHTIRNIQGSKDLGKQPEVKSAPSTILYPLWYGTNRKPIDPNNINRGYSGEPDDRIHYGSCQVSVPKAHKIGSTGSDWWTNLFGTADGLKLLNTADWNQPQTILTEMMPANFWADLQNNLKKRDPDERMALVFIHDFNVSFEEAALSAAQIGCDLGLPGLTAFYSWPSQGNLSGYSADEASIQASEQHIAEFLTDFVAESNAERVHIVAHSMGNRGLLRSLQRLATQFQGRNRHPFGQIFLTAPDEDPIVFRNLAPVCQGLAERTTLYVSDKGQALSTTSFSHKRDFFRYKPSITLVPGIDTVDVSRIDLSLLGHGYYNEARPLLEDMYDLLLEGTAPDRRFGLQKIETEPQRYWAMGK